MSDCPFQQPREILMTIRTAASVGLALFMTAIATPAFARHHTLVPQQSAEYDRHSVSGSFYYGVQPQAREARRERVKRPRLIKDAVEVKYSAHERSGGHSLVAKSGARASVSTAAMPHFQCLLDKLEGTGYRIDFMGGYASRGNSSAHPTGNALDINQTARNRVTRALPYGTTQMAESCGLVHGAVWSNPDGGHFELANKVGYVYRTNHYASRRGNRYAQIR